MTEFLLEQFSNTEKVFIETLGNYSRSKLPLLLLPEAESVVGLIWDIAGRERRGEFCSSCDDINDVVAAVRSGSYDGILCKNIDNLSAVTHNFLAGVLCKFSPDERGRLIFTAANFDALTPRLSEELAKIAFTFNPQPIADYEMVG